ncbi:C6 zinc finger domain-containing protein [Stagonosporopsis vannaccii]|nr:C6 zinc finger domain-containing protein [Stagonosporopsis vannaccii]
MSSVRLGPQDLLEYDARYGVIICRECQYAIQKSAIQSHLLRHKIFRHERHSLLSSIAQLTINEPDNVPLPPPTSKPLEALPTIPGLRCNFEECGSLYASSKRMRRHQLESHDMCEANKPVSMACSVTLQTFFRGTKIKYFEVTSVDSAATNKTNDELAIIEEDMARPEGHAPIQLPHTAAETCLSSTSVGRDASFNLQSLVYFHHFLSVTGSTLPLPDPKQPLYWQTEFVNQALQQKWLMAGLLALSASHMGALTHRGSAAIAHHDRSFTFTIEFDEGRKLHTQGSFNTSHQGTPTPREGILLQMSSMLACAHTLFFVKTNTRQHTLSDLLTSMRCLVTSDSALRPSDFPHSTAAAFGHAAQLLTLTTHDPTLAAILTRLDTLPTRMAEALGRPEDLRDVVIALSAIATLISSCVAAFETDEVAFWAMASWLARAADDFHQMLARESVAALVVLAHWAATLVARVEENGCWFLRGAARFVSVKIAEGLEGKRTAVRDLIEGL